MGIRRLRKSFSGLAAVLLLGAPAALQASSITYYLNQSNENVLFPDGTNYATVTIEDVGSDIQFTVAPVASQFSPGTNFGIQSFGFNVTSGGPAGGANFLLPSASWGVSAGTNQDGFGNFDWVVAGTGSTRADPLVFTITGVSGDLLSTYFALSSGTAGEGNVYFATHIAGFLDPRGENIPWGATKVTSAYFGGGTVVPLPAAAWLLLSGVAGLGALARRRRGAEGPAA
jgi:hypothetical protein